MRRWQIRVHSAQENHKTAEAQDGYGFWLSWQVNFASDLKVQQSVKLAEETRILTAKRGKFHRCAAGLSEIISEPSRLDETHDRSIFGARILKVGSVWKGKVGGDEKTVDGDIGGAATLPDKDGAACRVGGTGDVRVYTWSEHKGSTAKFVSGKGE